jgi:hypothetical protein
MAKQRRKLTPEEKAAKARRRAEFMTIFVNGRQKQVRRPQVIEGVAVKEFIRRNADPVWLHQNEMWECIAGRTDPEPVKNDRPASEEDVPDYEDEIPF